MKTRTKRKPCCADRISFTIKFLTALASQILKIHVLERLRKVNEPLNEKSNNLGFRPGLTQTRLYSQRSMIECLPMRDLIRNPEDWFSSVGAHLFFSKSLLIDQSDSYRRKFCLTHTCLIMFVSCFPSLLYEAFICQICENKINEFKV